MESVKKGINYWSFPREEGGGLPEPVAVLRRAADLGFDSVEFTFELEGGICSATTRKEAEKIRKAAEEIGIELPTVASGLAWQESPTDPDPDVRRNAIATYRKTIEVSAWLGAEVLLYVPGMVSAVFAPAFPPQSYDAVWERAAAAVKELLPTAERLGVRLAVENVWNRFLMSPREMREFVDQFASPYVGAYFDVGNVLAFGHPEDWIASLGQRILGVHLKDFKTSVGNLDGFVDLLGGDVDYHRVMQSFRDIGYAGPFTAEILPGTHGSVEKAAAAMRIIETY